MSTDPADQRRAARNLARRATHDLARAAGAQTITRPTYPGAHTTVPDVDPLAGLTASRRLELAASEQAASYVRAAREAGHTWHDIGTAMGLVPGGDAQQAGETVAEAAFTYAAGHPDTEHARRYGRSVTWTCGSCDRAISDHGLSNGPADDEVGHTDNCPRLAATVDAWDAEWGAIEADWEAGQ
ncbi:MAG TPA: hypothetical protein VNF47_11245 [Streptosporangiaceae bacterium]|nr:hypothetical protein [Streptosporangiaceae bacterium]